MLLFTMTIAPLAAQDLSGTAMLVEGTVWSQGLPGFLPNRIPSLFGRYETGKGVSVSVWAAFEPLVFDPALWQERTVAKNRAWFRVAGERKQVWCVSRTVPMRAGMEAFSKVTFVIEADSSVPEERCGAFLLTFIERSEFFFSSVNRAGDLSFPARLDTGQ
jgi:hypothetical protein